MKSLVRYEEAQMSRDNKIQIISKNNQQISEIYIVT
jgi:hypothetical protein